MIRPKQLFLASLILFFQFTTVCHAKSSSTFEAISDGLVVALPASALIMSAVEEDPADTIQYVATFLAQEGFVELMKEAMSETSIGERPSDEDKEGRSYGFISSHVSCATAGAIKLWDIYPENPYVKISSVVGVVLVGAQRIEGDHHTPLQVGLGVGTAFLFDWLGGVVSGWIRDDAEETLGFSEEEASRIMFSAALPERGDGLMGVISYSF